MNNILKIENLNKSFDSIIPINNISFTIYENDIVLITGNNGAGKTTLFNLISGLLKPTSGNIKFNNKNIDKLSVSEIAKLGIKRLYQQPKFFKNLSVWENLIVASNSKIENNIFNHIFNYKKVKKEDVLIKEQAINILKQFGLEHLSNSIVGELSYGQQKLISFCMLIMSETKLALLDEPFAGLNPQMIDLFSRMILKMRNQGITFLIIEHNINKAMAISNYQIILENGFVKSKTEINSHD